MERAPRLLEQHGFADFTLLSTPRAMAAVPGLAEVAENVREVASGQVPGVAAEMLDVVGDRDLVAHGGGRVIDVAKALASVTGADVAALPTTLSGAPMTGSHRLPAGAEDRAGSLVRPRLVIADPGAMTGLGESALRMTAMNALAHGADSLSTPATNPVSESLALRGVSLIAAALDQPREGRDVPGLALGALLCGYAIDSAGYALHHVVCQSLVRVCGTPHAPTNAALLPLTMASMTARAPAAIAALAEVLGTIPTGVSARIRALGGDPLGLGDLGGDGGRTAEAVEAMLARPELAATPDPPGREELEALVAAAW